MCVYSAILAPSSHSAPLKNFIKTHSRANAASNLCCTAKRTLTARTSLSRTGLGPSRILAPPSSIDHCQYNVSMVEEPVGDPYYYVQHVETPEEAFVWHA